MRAWICVHFSKGTDMWGCEWENVPECLKRDLFGKILSLAVFEGLFSTSLPTLSIFFEIFGQIFIVENGPNIEQIIKPSSRTVWMGTFRKSLWAAASKIFSQWAKEREWLVLCTFRTSAFYFWERERERERERESEWERKFDDVIGGVKNDFALS